MDSTVTINKILQTEDQPSTPLAKELKRKKREGANVLTPPTTGLVAGTRQLTLQPPNELSHLASNPRPGNLIVDLPPTSITMPRPFYRSISRVIDTPRFSVEDAQTAPSICPPSILRNLRRVEEDKTTSPLIPSSQSQNLLDRSGQNPSITHAFSVMTASYKLASEGSNRDVDSEPGAIPFIVSDDDNESTVGSSQTQPLSTFHVSPRKLPPSLSRTSLYNSDTFSLDMIPSSQSQENELIIPCGKQDDGRLRKAVSHIPATFKRDDRLPQRTLSDEMFSVPIQPSIFEHIFSDDKGPEIKLAAMVQPATEQGSESESDTENPRLELNYLYSKRRSISTVYFPLPEACGSSLHSHSQNIRTQDSSFLEPSMSMNTQGSTSSLPVAVKEFQAMFDDVDESYPPDFPASLRREFS
ncbi:unnamed protein product [Cyclocybe aegerita]|uniref:Uncharacterized protein n=1 Tax=Cyclocybe aegerita TaxID=1973307 RepID=A0A8S0WLE3_CYCAE|nr:unnamed protein product [Cyclocybe aegerita]